MPDFYEHLNQIETLLENTLTINELGQGLITVNDYLIDTNQQFEMLSPDFFSGSASDNPTVKAYQLFFQKMGIVPIATPEIPLIRDIPLRMKTHSNQSSQQAICARFLEETILPNNLSMLFRDEYQELYQEISQCMRNTRTPKQRKKITTDDEGNSLASGGYSVELHQINGLDLWLRTPNSTEDADIESAIKNSLQDSINTDQIVASLKFKLLEKNRVAFNVRGVSKLLESPNDLRNLGGGHQHFLLLDRNTKTIYAINNTLGATDEDPLSFKHQIELFLKSLGDHTEYTFQFIQGKSRQPESQSYLSQVCNISQFCHYAAILSGIQINQLRETVPPKVTTLMYLLQYAIINQDQQLSTILDGIINTINPQPTEQLTSHQVEPTIVLTREQKNQPKSMPLQLDNQPDRHDQLQQDSASSNPEQAKLIEIIDILINNIHHQRNGRQTKRNSDWKTSQFEKIKQELQKESAFSNDEVPHWINRIHKVCAQKRNALHFWATPHSVKEFERLLTEKNIDTQLPGEIKNKFE
ncbi:hypothetical protein [Legionella bononiensis]|uniref:Substrate of the Dot/Icm secretion system n=1 Tax=Legionella bononiensis TaxID=2793102 RepID=A0ABS1W8I9_9GAMM|nr:hypothetical protein [Legionella bononiensis]MBL7479807.1 hypothetical protein [Legionella bononiensis]MBL7525678.1 hypothetical protein [Legionella bononiensis]MBL7561861.1 hypothetical protein [Legionella bononiensis]